ncbi:FecR domain-containing protein [Anaerolineales bacterium HSG25]|nr:FecR domain-containing protein [Anaerolineales bacterium HSG25]
MRKNPERTAWIIISTAFVMFWVISCSIATSIYWYLFYGTEPFNSDLTSVRDIVLLEEVGSDNSTFVTDGQSSLIAEGATITTDDTSQAILAFGDDSSLTMYGNTTITLLETQEPRFFLSSLPIQTRIYLQKGRIRVTTARGRETLNVDVTTPQTEINFDQGSFSVEVNDDETQVITRLGQAHIIGDEVMLTLNRGNRVVVGADGHPSPPLPAAQNLLGEGSFSPTYTDTWTSYQYDEAEGVTTSIEPLEVKNQTVIEFKSTGQDNTHSEIGIVKEVNKDVRDFRSLKLLADVQLINQSLEGGGYQGTEFPIMLAISYKDAEGTDRNWFHGVYYSIPPDNYVLTSHPSKSTERIARFIWYPYESDNLLTILGREKPVYITSIRVYASGWLYQARVGNVSLLGEE